MRKGWLVAWLLAITLVLTGCGNFRDVTEVEESAIPEHVSHIEFWNGGACIGDYDNCTVHLIIENNVHRTMSLTKDDTKVVFYKYEIKVLGKDPEFIIDSEALAIKFRE